MKFIHISDLHLGKRIHDFSMIDEQQYIMNEIIKITDEEKPDAVLIAGDIYDKTIPTTDAVELFDEFLVNMSQRAVKTFVISGNHDSAERIAFGGRLMKTSGIYLSPVYSGNITPIVLNDKYGPVNIYMLPFIKPIHVRSIFNDTDIRSYTDAISKILQILDINTDERNILITHQFVTGASRSESEDISVGGTDNVDVNVFDKFDYVALGHIHGAQHINRDTVRYCGTPLKYSFSESKHKKSLTIVNMNEKGDIKINERELIPLHDMRELRGDFSDIISQKKSDDYIHVILTDENDIPDAVSTLRVVYPNIMSLSYDNSRTRTNNNITSIQSVQDIDPTNAFAEFFEMNNGLALNDEQSSYLKNIINEIWGE